MPKVTQPGDRARMHPQGCVSDARACPRTGGLSPRSESPGSHGGRGGGVSGMLFISSSAREDEEQAVSVKPPDFRTSMARDRYTPGLDTAEGAQRRTKPMASHQSSLTSLEESGPAELLPRKALLRAGGSHTEVSVPVGYAQKIPRCLSSFPGLCPPWPSS